MSTKKQLQTTQGLVIGKGASTATFIEVTAFPGASGKSQTVPEGSIAVGASGSGVAGKIYRKHTPGSGTDKWLGMVDTDDLTAAVVGDKLFDPKDSCFVATTAALDVTAAGAKVGKTLTANANGAIAMDGESPALGDRVVVKNGSIANGAVDNGIYEVTTVGDGSNPYVLTRAGDTDDDLAAEVTAGANTWVEAGTVNANTRFILLGTGDVDVDVDTQNWDVFLKFGDVSALFTEVNNIETTLGSAINADGTFAGYSSTNHIDGATSFTNADELLDAEIGADLTANVRTNNAVTAGGTLNANLEKIDDAIGSDVQLTPLTRATGQIALANTLYTNLDAVDLYLGEDTQLTPVSRTVGAVSNAQSTKQLSDNLDLAIGADPTPEARTTGPILTTNSANANIDAVDVAIGPDTTINNYTDVNDSVNENLDALDGQTKSNTDRLDDLASKVSTTTSGGGGDEIIDQIGADDANYVEWQLLVRESASNTKVLSIVVGAVHDGTTTSDAADIDTFDHSLVEIPSQQVAGFDWDIKLNGVGAAQEVRLVLNSTNALDVEVERRIRYFT